MRENIEFAFPLYQSVLKSSSKTTKMNWIAGTSMIFKRCRRKLDLFSVLLLLVALGMSATLAYQINVYYGADRVPIAKQTPTGSIVGG